MIQMILNDVAGILRATFLNGDWVSLAIAFGSVATAAVFMRRTTQIGAMTLFALALFVVAGYVRGVLAGPGGPEAPSTGARAASQLEAAWLRFMDMQASAVLAYFIAFMALIFVLYSVKAVLSRG